MPYNRLTAKRKWTISEMKKYHKFCGWDTLQRLIDAVDFGLKGPSGEILVHNDLERRRGRALIATVFETGARISEIIGQEDGDLQGLKVEDVKVTEDFVNVIFQVAKRYRKRRKVRSGIEKEGR